MKTKINKSIIITFLLVMFLALTACSSTTIKSIEFINLPDELYGFTGDDSLDKFSETTIKITYTDGKVIEANLASASNYGVKVTGLTFDSVGIKTITASYGTISASFEYEVMDMLLFNLQVKNTLIREIAIASTEDLPASLYYHAEPEERTPSVVDSKGVDKLNNCKNLGNYDFSSLYLKVADLIDGTSEATIYLNGEEVVNKADDGFYNLSIGISRQACFKHSVVDDGGIYIATVLLNMGVIKGGIDVKTSQDGVFTKVEITVDFSETPEIELDLEKSVLGYFNKELNGTSAKVTIEEDGTVSFWTDRQNGVITVFLPLGYLNSNTMMFTRRITDGNLSYGYAGPVDINNSALDPSLGTSCYGYVPVYNTHDTIANSDQIIVDHTITFEINIYILGKGYVKITGTITYHHDENCLDCKAKAKSVIDLINKIAGKTENEKTKAITDARTAYNALKKFQKTLVTNYQVLEDAENEQSPSE